MAILDTGIRWDDAALRRQIHLNTGELPFPLHDRASSLEPGGPACSSYTANAYDADGDGAVDVVDYACDSRVSLSYAGRLGPPGLITGQDLLHAFGDCQISAHQIVSAFACPAGASFDNDSNGYANDIVGWNFFDNNNDPTDRSSYFAAAESRQRARERRRRAGQRRRGIDRRLPALPVHARYACGTPSSPTATPSAWRSPTPTDNGVKVIEGADGSLYHSAFAEAASQYAYDHGVVQTYSGDDLNTGNHNYPGNYSHAMLDAGHGARHDRPRPEHPGSRRRAHRRRWSPPPPVSSR